MFSLQTEEYICVVNEHAKDKMVDIIKVQVTSVEEQPLKRKFQGFNLSLFIFFLTESNQTVASILVLKLNSY